MDASLQTKFTGAFKFFNLRVPSLQSPKKWRLWLRRWSGFPLKLLSTAVCILFIQALFIGTLDLLFGISPQVVFVTLNLAFGFFFAVSLLSRHKTVSNGSAAQTVISDGSPVCKILTIQEKAVGDNSRYLITKGE